MSNLQCPYCHTSMPKGATVCPGCEAEVEYGIPGNVVYIMLLVAVVAGYIAGDLLSSALVGLIIGFIVFIGMSERLNVVFKERVEFKRNLYQTKTKISTS